MAPFILPVGSAATTVRVQPVVLFNVCDAYVRRNEGQERVIGTLLGVISDGVIDVRNCYAVPHDESSERVCELNILHNPRLVPFSRSSASMGMHVIILLQIRRIHCNNGCILMQLLQLSGNCHEHHVYQLSLCTFERDVQWHCRWQWTSRITSF